MTLYQIRTRVVHFFTAIHWRGAAIHSPMMYEFVRQYAMRYRGKELIRVLIDKLQAESVDINNIVAPISLIGYIEQPYKNAAEHHQFMDWYKANHAVVAHFQGLVVIFFDKKFQKQFFMIRN